MQRVYPYLLYDDAAAAAEFLSAAFGFRRVEAPTTAHGHASHTHVEMDVGDGFRVRMTSPDGDFRSPRAIGQVASMIQIDVVDIDAHFARAEAAGASIVRPLEQRRYGDRGYIVDDPAGHRWYFIQRHQESAQA